MRDILDSKGWITHHRGNLVASFKGVYLDKGLDYGSSTMHEDDIVIVVGEA